MPTQITKTMIIGNAGRAVMTRAGEWVRDSTPNEGAEHIAVCLPAASPGALRQPSRGPLPTLQRTRMSWLKHF